MALINKALLHPKEFNVEELKFQFDKEDEEIETKKQEWTELRKRIVTERKYVEFEIQIVCFYHIEKFSQKCHSQATFSRLQEA